MDLELELEVELGLGRLGGEYIHGDAGAGEARLQLGLSVCKRGREERLRYWIPGEMAHNAWQINQMAPEFFSFITRIP